MDGWIDEIVRRPGNITVRVFRHGGLARLVCVESGAADADSFAGALPGPWTLPAVGVRPWPGADAGMQMAEFESRLATTDMRCWSRMTAVTRAHRNDALWWITPDCIVHSYYLGTLAFSRDARFIAHPWFDHTTTTILDCPHAIARALAVSDARTYDSHWRSVEPLCDVIEPVVACAVWNLRTALREPFPLQWVKITSK